MSLLHLLLLLHLAEWLAIRLLPGPLQFATPATAAADALVIEAQAKQRLADEYDAIPEEARDKGGGNEATRSTSERVSAGALGLSRKQIHEARQIRDAERADPGIVRRTVDERVAAGEEPTKAAVREAVTELREGRAPVRGTTGTGDNEWFTPAEHIERARRVLGDFDLDPASHAVAQERVRAARFFTVEDDGLVQEWAGRVWLNPPYAQPAIAHFAAKVAEEYGAGRISAAIVLTHNYTDTAWFQGLARTAAAICFTRGRIRFEAPDGSLAAPTQGQAFFYLGSNTAAFAREFSDVGLLVFPSHAIEEANAA